MNDDQKAELKKELEQIQQAIAGQEAARGILPDEQIDAILQTLHAKQRQLTNALTGSGAISQGEGATAVGGRGVHVSGDVEGRVITGDANRFIEAGQYYEHYHAADPAQAVDIKTLRHDYLARLLLETGRLSLAGIDPKAASDDSETRLNLSAVYTALLTIHVEPIESVSEFAEKVFGPGKSRPKSALAQLNDQQRLVLLGDPGSGKSTLTRRWAGLLAALGQPAQRKDWTDDEQLAASEMLRVFDRWLLPVRVVLSQWAQRLPDNGPAGATGCAGDLAAECWHVWSRIADLHGDSAARQHFLNKLVGDRPAVLLLLDGLDEVTDPARRTTLLQAIRDFVVTYPSVPMVVTSRVRPYAALQRQGDALDWPAATLDKLTPQAIDHFVDRWHAELVATHEWEARLAGERQTHLTAALADTRRAELREMAGTPLLLTMMVKVNYKERLPDSRAELYETFVRQLLFEWERRRSIEGGEHTDLDRLLEEAEIPPDQFVLRLNAMAYQVHDGADRDSVDIPTELLKRTLMNLFIGLEVDDDPDTYDDDDAVAAALKWARQVMRLMADRSGLINWEDHNVYRFSHRSYQEYLAARWMATGRDFRDKFRARIDDEDWREAVLLAIVYQGRVRGAPFDDTLDILYDFWPEQLGTQAATYRALLIGEAFSYQLEMKRLGKGRLARDLQERIIADLTALMKQPALTAYPDDAKAQARTRLAAGLLLADLEELPKDLDDLVTVPGASFRIG
ncbi:MAG: hypothetical protein KC441_17955, partial [Anaerolineales bacterium]|nr:hypothetical protein [Anaerolineales bacterium]